MHNKRKRLLGIPQITCPGDRVLAKGCRTLHSRFTSCLAHAEEQVYGQLVQLLVFEATQS